MWNIAPIAHALWHRKAGALLIATQVALTLAILCNALGVVLDRRDQASRPTGTVASSIRRCSPWSPGAIVSPIAQIIRVSIGPGASTFARMPRPAHSSATTRVMPTTACLDAT